MSEEQVDAAAEEICAYIRELLSPWTNFYGHKPHIAEIIRKHITDGQTTREDGDAK